MFQAERSLSATKIVIKELTSFGQRRCPPDFRVILHTLNVIARITESLEAFFNTEKRLE